MKKIYQKPSVEITEALEAEIIATSITSGEDTGVMEGPIYVDAKGELGTIWDPNF